VPDPDPVFFGVVFYGSDRIWLIDADQEVGTALEDGIKAMWVDGVRDARVRERHAREIKLRGNPCEYCMGHGATLDWHDLASSLFSWCRSADRSTGTSHNQQALISARIIHLVIRRLASMAGYEFACSVCMSDLDEAQIPFSIYRLKHDAQFNVPHIEPVSQAAAKSMSIGR
jgi:hypothetical protein